VYGFVFAAAMTWAATPTPKSKPKPKPPLTAEQRAAQSLMKPLNLHDRVAQLVIGVCYGASSGTQGFQKRCQ